MTEISKIMVEKIRDRLPSYINTENMLLGASNTDQFGQVVISINTEEYGRYRFLYGRYDNITCCINDERSDNRILINCRERVSNTWFFEIDRRFDMVYSNYRSCHREGDDRWMASEDNTLTFGVSGDCVIKKEGYINTYAPTFEIIENLILIPDRSNIARNVQKMNGMTPMFYYRVQGDEITRIEN